MQNNGGLGLDTKDNRRLRGIFIAIIVILVGTYLANFVDFFFIKDRGQYNIYAYGSNYYWGQYRSQGIITLLTNEPIFLILNQLLNLFFKSIFIVQLYIVVSYSLTAFLVSKQLGYSLYPVVLYSAIPQGLKNNIMQIRQGLGISIYLLGFQAKNKYVRLLRFLAPFIHTSMLFFVVVEGYEYCMDKMKISRHVRLIIFTGVSVLIAALLPIATSIIGDRRAMEYSFSSDQSASGLSFIFWIVFFVIFYIYSDKNQYTTFSAYGIVFYLSTYFLTDISARVFESFLPFILISVLKQSNKIYKLILILLLLVFSALGWYTNHGIIGWSIAGLN